MEGVLDFSGGDARIQVGDDAIVNLFGGGVLGSDRSKLTVGANSLTIYAPGAHPADTFDKFTTKGILHEAGQVLDIRADEGFAGRGRIDDHVVCAGTITASVGGGIDLNNGLMVTSGGSVDLSRRYGTLRVNNMVSGLAGGSLSARNERIGDTSTGSFSHTAGTNTIDRTLHLGYDAGGNGTYELSGTGQLSARSEYVGYNGTGHFVQTGGTNTIRRYGNLYLGYEPGSHGTYSISGGTLEANAILVGSDGHGTFNILSSDASITVKRNRLSFGANSVLTAVEGSTIRMNNARLGNKSTDPAALGGMNNLKVVFEGRSYKNTFEVAGEDMGVSLAGLDLNFALHALQVGTGDVRGKLELVDNFDNQPGWVGDEALYVKNLIIEGVGSSIDLNGLNLYYLNGGDPKQLFHADSNLDGRVDVTDLTALAASWSFLSPGDKEWSQGDTNGDMLIDIVDLTALAANWGAETIVIPGGAVPEPTALVLLALGGFALIRRHRK